MSSEGYFQVDAATLRRVLHDAGINKASDASDLLRDRMRLSSSKYVVPKELLRVRKAAHSWLADRDGTRELQAKSLQTLKTLVGSDALTQLLNAHGHRLLDANDNRAARIPEEIRDLLADFQKRPAMLYQEPQRAIRGRLIELLAELERPVHHDGLAHLRVTISQYAAGSIDIIESLEPFIRAFPVNRLDEGFDTRLLCQIGQLGNDMAETIDRRQLSVPQLTRYEIARNVMAFVFSLLEEIAYRADSIDGRDAMYQTMRHRYARVSIAGDSPFNLGRFSLDRPLANALRFNAEMQIVADLCMQLQRMPPIGSVEPKVWGELLPVYEACRLRMLCFAQDRNLHPTEQEIHGVIDSVRTPGSLGVRTATLFAYFVSTGQLKKAAAICDDVRSRAKASKRSMPEILEPIYSVNSYRLGGSVSRAEYRDAMANLADNPDILLISGHQLLHHKENAALNARIDDIRGH